VWRLCALIIMEGLWLDSSFKAQRLRQEHCSLNERMPCALWDLREDRQGAEEGSSWFVLTLLQLLLTRLL